MQDIEHLNSVSKQANIEGVCDAATFVFKAQACIPYVRYLA